eukprot:CAMPEP_0170563952 /NCGR_PEP_ID=MMETSP0211-20121228/70006_1 /TAXON_ID=311385 /ORGANISM="Pseudokeronopsis sp., Strain OXSARD2" /LENGTH=76 /DNA_ID=CAMNT_0010882827 /DNA_START=8 /DNA_END=234 /DNA_ORIENTATION=-
MVQAYSPKASIDIHLVPVLGVFDLHPPLEVLSAPELVPLLAHDLVRELVPSQVRLIVLLHVESDEVVSLDLASVLA